MVNKNLDKVRWQRRLRRWENAKATIGEIRFSIEQCIFDERPYSPVDVAANGKRGLTLEYDITAVLKC